MRKEAPFRLDGTRLTVVEGGQTSQRRAVAALVVLVAALVWASGAAAHARVVATQPEQGTVVPTAPAQVSFRFDEGVRVDGKVRLSGGKLAEGQALPTNLQSHGTLLVAQLPKGLADGDYVATWRVVSDDGHLETGAVAFGVGVDTPPPAAVVDQQTQRDWTLTIARWIFLAGLLAGSGIVAVRLLTGRREQDLADGAIATALGVALVGALLEVSRLPGAVHTRFGLVTWIAAGVATAGALAAVARLVVAAEALALALLLAPPLSGHALASDRPLWLAFPSDVVHTAAAAIWIGGVAWLALLAARRRPGLRDAARGFSRVALVAVVVLGVSGVARAGAELRSLHEVWDTSYGQLLVAKSVLFAALLGVGWISSRGERLRLSLPVEGVLLGALLAAVAGLSTVTPPRNAPRPLQAIALPGPAVVFGREAGKLAVGIAAAAQDGRLGVRVTVIDETGTNDNDVDVSVQGEDAERCGDGVYCGSGPADRTIELEVDGHPLSVTLPDDPQHAKARRIVRAAAAATRALRSVVIHERLAADPVLVLETTFRIVHPDRMTYRSVVHENGTTRFSGQAIVIGGTRWDRAKPDGPWERSLLEPLNQPVPDWRKALDPSLLGETGETWRVSFRDPTVPAWFEVTIDKRTSRPLRVDMTAAAHFMTRLWGSFDDPIRITAPR
jgi:copper transport protein